MIRRLKKGLALLIAIAMVIAFMPIITFSTFAADATLSNILQNGDEITKGGIYFVNPNSKNSVVTISTTEQVTIKGTGSEDEDKIENLEFSCTVPDVNLTFKNVYLSDDASRQDKPLIDITGKDNNLNFEGESVLEKTGNNAALIHVAIGNAATIGGSGTLYLSNVSQGSGIGGNEREYNGDITFSINRLFAKGSKQGALIGAGADAASGLRDAQLEIGSITFISGEYNLIACARGAAIGGSGTLYQGVRGTNVYMKGGTVNVNIDYSGAAVGGGGNGRGSGTGMNPGNETDGGTFIVTGGSFRVYTDISALITPYGWAGRTLKAGTQNDTPITAKRINAAGTSVYRAVVSTDGVKANDNGNFVVKVDGVVFYEGKIHQYGYVNEDIAYNDQLALPIKENWYKNNDNNLYLYLTGKDHIIEVNGVKSYYIFDSNSQTLEKANTSVAKVKTLKLKKGKKKVTIQWSAVAEATGYQIYRSTNKNKGFKCVKTVKSAKTVKYINSKLKSKKNYYYKVRAYKTVCGKTFYGQFSSIKSVKTC